MVPPVKLLARFFRKLDILCKKRPAFQRVGGLYWTRTSDPIDVNDVLYQLSQQTKVGFPELPFAVIRHIRIGEGAFDESYHMVLPTEPCDQTFD